MQINLKQTEIENALKGYIAQQGISLSGKKVTLTFTAGRKESGISAEVSIEDQDIPDFGEAEAEMLPQAPVLTCIPAGINLGTATVVPPAAEEVVTEGGKTTSLFG